MTKLPQLADAVAAFDLALDAEAIAALEAPYLPREVVGLAMPMPARHKVAVLGGDAA